MLQPGGPAGAGNRVGAAVAYQRMAWFAVGTRLMRVLITYKICSSRSLEPVHQRRF
jgi:hypothetical protein